MTSQLDILEDAISEYVSDQPEPRPVDLDGSQFDRALTELTNILEDHAADLRARLGREKGADGSWKPVVHVLMPDGKEHPFRSAAVLIPGDCGEPEPDDDASHQIRALLINGYGEVICNADIGDPVVMNVPPMLVRFDDQRRMTQKEVAKMAAVDRSTVYKATRAGHLKPEKLEGKHPRYVQEQVKAWLRGETKSAKKR